MTCHYLTIDKLTMIVNFRDQGVRAYRVARLLYRNLETVYRVYRFLIVGPDTTVKTGLIAVRRLFNYPLMRQPISKPKWLKAGHQTRLWGALNGHSSCSIRTLYRPFERGNFDVRTLPMKGKCRPNGYIERRGKADQLGQSIHQRTIDFPSFNRKLGHLEADTVQGRGHQGTVMILVERTPKIEVILNVHSKMATGVVQRLQEWLAKFPPHFLKSITFGNGGGFTDWRVIANQFGLQTHFAEAGIPLDENGSGLPRCDGLHKGHDLHHLADEEVTRIMSYRNNTPHKSLDYQTPYEVLMKYVVNERLLFFQLKLTFREVNLQ